MSSESERLKQLRKVLNIKQGDFAKKISTTQGHISDIENGRKNLSDRTIKLICLESWDGRKVNEDWLRTGEGGEENMFIPEDMIYLQNVGKLGSETNEFKKFYLNMMMNLPDEYWDYIYNEFKKFDKNKEE